MLELLFVIGFFVMLLVTGVSLLGIIAAIVVATALMQIAAGTTTKSKSTSTIRPAVSGLFYRHGARE